MYRSFIRDLLAHPMGGPTQWTIRQHILHIVWSIRRITHIKRERILHVACAKAQNANQKKGRGCISLSTESAELESHHRARSAWVKLHSDACSVQIVAFPWPKYVQNCCKERRTPELSDAICTAASQRKPRILAGGGNIQCARETCIH